MTALPSWLFVSYGGGHVQALLPVARWVRQQGMARPVYLALTTAAATVRATGIETLGFADFLRAGDERARTHGERLADDLQVQATDRAESVAYLGLSYAELEDRLGVAGAAGAFARYGRQAFLPLGILQHVLEQVQPALVVATNSPRAEEAAIEVARQRGIPSACLVDLFGIWERERLARPDFADAVCVLNEAVGETLVRAGRPPAAVHVTGNPAFDAVNDPAVVAAGRQLRADTGWAGLRVALYASSPEPVRIAGVAGTGDPDLPRRIERELLQAVQADPALALWVRRHPSEPPPDDLRAHPRIRASGRELPLHACLHASDEVFVTVSTVGVEAALAGKPVTQVHGSILDHLSPYVAMGIAQRAVRPGDIAAAWRRPLASAAPRPAATNATQRVTAVLQSLASARHAG